MSILAPLVDDGTPPVLREYQVRVTAEAATTITVMAVNEDHAQTKAIGFADSTDADAWTLERDSYNAEVTA